jgi:Icc-related predicted phosphoesterase
MRICHSSDNHWGFYRLPKADLYIFTGDEYDNYLRLTKVSKKFAKRLDFLGQDGHGGSYIVDRKNEARMQLKAAAEFVNKGGMQNILGSPDAPVICVPGNHDFVDLAPLFVGCNLVHEFVNNEVIEVAGLRVTGHRGVPPINGAWNHEMSDADLGDRIRGMDPDCDLYLTHYPPSGIGLDLPGSWGASELTNFMMYKTTRPHVLHCFGHIHEAAGWRKVNNFLFVNSARTHHVIEGDPHNGWTVGEDS